jgi:hypothetical protein
VFIKIIIIMMKKAMVSVERPSDETAAALAAID